MLLFCLVIYIASCVHRVKLRIKTDCHQFEVKDDDQEENEEEKMEDEEDEANRALVEERNECSIKQLDQKEKEQEISLQSVEEASEGTVKDEKAIKILISGIQSIDHHFIVN